jgi:nucleoid DNA-binding protein
MAQLFRAVKAYGPRLELSETAQIDDLVMYMTQRTSLNRSEVYMVLYEIHEALLHFNRRGQPVKLPGIGTFTPVMDRHGTIRIRFRPVVELKKGINNLYAYWGKIVNKRRMKWTDADYKQQWDADHPDDPLAV